jgi:hypothetical protein
MAIDDQSPNPVAGGDPPNTDGSARARLRNAVVVGVLVLLILASVVAIVFQSQSPSSHSEPLPDVAKLATPDLPLDHGTALALVLGFDCGHCKEVGRLVSTFDTGKLGIRVYVLGLGTEEEASLFFAETGIQAPYRLITNQEYLDYSGADSTTLYLLRDGQTLSVWPGYDFGLAKLKSALAAGL